AGNSGAYSGTAHSGKPRRGKRSGIGLVGRRAGDPRLGSHSLWVNRIVERRVSPCSRASRTRARCAVAGGICGSRSTFASRDDTLGTVSVGKLQRGQSHDVFSVLGTRRGHVFRSTPPDSGSRLLGDRCWSGFDAVHSYRVPTVDLVGETRQALRCETA